MKYFAYKKNHTLYSDIKAIYRVKSEEIFNRTSSFYPAVVSRSRCPWVLVTIIV